MIKFALCDSNLSHLESLEQLVHSILQRKEHSVFCFGDATGILSYLDNIQGFVDVLFINLSLNDADGMLTAKKIARLYPAIKVVALSKTADEIEELFEIKPAFFLFEPVREEKLQKCLDLIVLDIEMEDYEFLSLTNKNGLVNILFQSITYIESDKRKITIFEDETNNSFYATLDDVQKRLGGSFLRCHKSYLVNMNKIKLFSNDSILLYSGEIIPISQKKYYQAKRDFVMFITDRVDNVKKYPLDVIYDCRSMNKKIV